MNNGSRFITSTGREIRILPISQITIARIRTSVEEKYRKMGKRLSPPTYTVVDVAGTTETFPHNAVTIESSVSEEEKKEWDEYIEALAEMDNEMRNKITQYLYLNGLSVAEDSAPEYLEMCAFFEIPIPENRLEAKFQYIIDYVLPTPGDKTEAMLLIMRTSGVQKEVVEAVEDSFRGILDSGEETDTTAKTTDEERELV